MKLFLDTSILLAACGSAKGSSRALFHYAPAQGWQLLASPWVMGEVTRNLVKFPIAATAEWLRLRQQLVIVDDVVSLDRALVFPVNKDKPVLLSALNLDAECVRFKVQKLELNSTVEPIHCPQ